MEPNGPPLKTSKTWLHWASTLDIPMKCECPGNPVYSGKYEAYSGSLQCKDKESNGFPWGLVNKLSCSWGGCSVYSKGRRMQFTVAWRRSRDVEICLQSESSAPQWVLGDGVLQPLLKVKKPGPVAKTSLSPATRGFLVPGEVTHCLMPGGLDLRRRFPWCLLLCGMRQYSQPRCRLCCWKWKLHWEIRSLFPW